MNKIKREFWGKRVVGLPESVMRILSMWFMQKSRKVVQVNTNMKAERVSLPKPTYKLCELDDDDEDVFATSIIDRYAAHDQISLQIYLWQSLLFHMILLHSEIMEMMDLIVITIYGNLMEKTVMWWMVQDNPLLMSEHTQNNKTLKLKDGLGYMCKRKKQTILRTRQYK